MAETCGKCGTELDTELDLCPVCDKAEDEQKKDIPNFCTFCGSPVDKLTGSCPNCVKVSDYQKSEQTEGDTAVLKEKKKGWITVVLVLMCILVFITSVAAVAIAGLRNTATSKGIEKILDDLAFSDLMSIKGSSGESPLENINEYLEKNAKITITADQVDSFVEKSSLKPFLADKIANYADELFAGGVGFTLTRQEIYNLFDENSEVIFSEFGTHIPASALEAIANWATKAETLDKISVSNIKENHSVIYYLLHIGFSYLSLAVMIILCLVFVFVMAKINLSKATLGTGIVFTALGGILSVAALTAGWIPSLWEAVFGSSLVSYIVGEALFLNAVIFCIVLFIGVALLVARKIVPFCIAKKNKN